MRAVRTRLTRHTEWQRAVVLVAFLIRCQVKHLNIQPRFDVEMFDLTFFAIER